MKILFELKQVRSMYQSIESSISLLLAHGHTEIYFKATRKGMLNSGVSCPHDAPLRVVRAYCRDADAAPLDGKPFPKGFGPQSGWSFFHSLKFD